MADLPILNAADPSEIPAKVYDRVWVEEVIISAPDPNGDITGEVKLHKYGMFTSLDEEGNEVELAEFDPEGGQWIRVPNMLEKSETDANLQAAMAGIIGYVAQLGVENNIISTP
tara:strand:+ start:3692 stop:4033 length:342 start_codon:yes stop_codon:yes gene_type:complete